MTRGEASEVITIIRGEVHPAVQKEWEQMAADVCIEALDLAIAALKGPAREQVEKARGEWEWFDEIVGTPIDGYEREWGWQCSKCKTVLPDEFDNPDDSPAMRFCQWCGAPMTDEAVDIFVKRMEEMRNG